VESNIKSFLSLSLLRVNQWRLDHPYVDWISKACSRIWGSPNIDQGKHVEFQGSASIQWCDVPQPMLIYAVLDLFTYFQELQNITWLRCQTQWPSLESYNRFCPCGHPWPRRYRKDNSATAALHHPVIMQKYPIRHFGSRKSINTSFTPVSILGSHLGSENSRQLSQIIVYHFRQCGPCLLVLDNFETPWEPSRSRSKVENFLSALTEVPNLTLLVSLFVIMSVLLL
jgi:hypothetical protein